MVSMPRDANTTFGHSEHPWIVEQKIHHWLAGKKLVARELKVVETVIVETPSLRETVSSTAELEQEGQTLLELCKKPSLRRSVFRGVI